jgi:mono/diheme cytochrome c family protein
MRRVLKGIAYILGAVVVLLLVAGSFIYVSSNRRLARHYDVAVQTPPISGDAVVLARGHHLAVTRGCADCHGADLAGAKVVENAAIGRLYGPNLTHGQGSVTANYGDADWVRAIRHGVSPAGRALFLMPAHEYANLSESDLNAIVVYVKSVPAVDRASVPLRVGPVARLLVVMNKFPIAAEVIDHGHLQPSTVTVGVTPEYGRYLAVGCVGCHGPNYSGGKIAGGPPDWPPAANLTAHPASNLSRWNASHFIAALRTGRRPDGSEISPVMPRNFGQMTDDELNAIWAFLKTLPAVPTGSR